MAAGAKLQKSFQDYFRIPVLLKPVGNTSQQAINHIATIFNQIDRFSINQNEFSLSSPQFPVNRQKIKKNPQLYDRIANDMKNRGCEESYKLLFLSDEFDNDWSEFEIIYKVSFVILVYSGEQAQNQLIQSIEHRKSQTIISTTADLNERINKINMRLKEKDKELLGIIFLNDTQEFSKTLIPGLKFTIVPPSLPLEQLSMFIEPWLIDLIPKIEQNIVEHILECRYEENTIIVFNRSEDKSEPKIMKKKKKFRCLKISGDLALMLHLYQFAYESYHQADEQLKKVDDWMWVLGCIQGKIACMTSNGDLNVRESTIEKEIDQLINESFIFSKKIKYQSFEIQNLFKILKLLLHEDKEKFDDIIETTLYGSKGLTQEEKFLYYSYIGSLYAKASMERKRNYYYYKASLIIQNFKPQISQLLLKTIKQSKYIKEWQELNSKVIQKIIQNEQYFSPDGQMHLQLLEKCSGVLNQKEIQAVKDYLNYGNFEEREIEGSGEKLIEVKEFGIVESLIKPKPNRLISDESPKKGNTSGIFVGWKKKLTYLYQDGQLIIFKGTIVNKLPFEIRLKVFIQISDNSQTIPEFSLILPPSYPLKFKKEISFSFSEQPISIKRIKFCIWNFILYKSIEPELCFELYEKQPVFDLEVDGGEKVFDQRQKVKIQMEQSSELSLKCTLKKLNLIECDRLRVACSVYYDIDVGFQENQYIFSIENKFNNIDFFSEKIPNIKFKESLDKESSIEFGKDENIILLKLKKFKTTRNHIKKLEINLDYIKQNTSKYQLNKQYIVEPKFVNSVWAEVLQISTPCLQTAVQTMKNLSQNEIKQFKQNWNVIEDSFLARIRFSKNQFNLRPFKVWPLETKKNSNAVVIGQNEVILSNLTDGEMLVKLPKAKISLKQKQEILSSSRIEEKESEMAHFIEPLTFRWQNVVNKNMQGVINLAIIPNPLMFCPKLQINVKAEKVQNSRQTTLSNCRTYSLVYTMLSESGEQIKPHKVTVKAYSDIQAQSQTNQTAQTNQNQSLGNEGANSSNINILVMGKTKVNRVITKIHSVKSHQIQNELQNPVQKRQFTNPLKLRIIRQKLNENCQKQKDSQVSIVVTIEFDQKQIGKWQQVIKLL